MSLRSKVSVKKFSWVSLMLLLAAYSTFSWFLYGLTAAWIVLLAFSAFALIQGLLLTTWSAGLRRFIDRVLQSDLGYFSAVMLLGLFTVALLVWVHVLGRFLLMVAAETLARLDLQSAGINRFRALAILTTVAFLGLAIGWIVRYGTPAIR